MAYTYLKKRNMIVFARKQLGMKVVPDSVDCHYRQGDGFELLKFIGNDCNRYEIFINGGYYARITVFDVDDDGVPFVIREEIVRDI